MTTDDDARARGYLISQAERYDMLALWPRVIADRTALLLAFERVSEEQARWRTPSAADWNILEIAQHSLVWAQSVTKIIETLAAGGTAETLPLSHLHGGMATTLDAVRSAFVQDSIRFAALPERLPPEPDIAATAEHPRFGPLNYRAWFLFSRLHDGDHLRQIEAVRAADGYPSG